MYNKSEREKAIEEYNELKKRAIEVRNRGEHDKIGELHLQVHKKYEEVLACEKKEER